MANYLEATKAKTKEEAEIFLSALIAEARKEDPALSEAEARTIQLSNIGYYFGYLSEEDLPRALEVYPEASHPLFGRIFGDLPYEILIKAGSLVAEKGQAAAKAFVEEYRKNRIILRRTVDS